MVTIVTIEGHSFEAADTYDQDGCAHSWIRAGQWIQNTITERVGKKIEACRVSRQAAGLPVRDVVDAAMRVQRDISDYWWSEYILVYDDTVSTAKGSLRSLVEAIERLMARLDEFVLYAVEAGGNVMPEYENRASD